MTNFPFNERKALAAVLFVIQQLGGSVGKHKLAKILYFADKKHLVKYMRPIFGDDYIAMPYGPVPSRVYNGVKGEGDFVSFREVLNVRNKVIYATEKPDMDVLSQSDIECLMASVAENGNLSFQQLVEKSHQFAYKNANGRVISVVDMAREEGASDEVIAYIEDIMSDYQLMSSL